jgi:hypothetical protein
VPVTRAFTIGAAAKIATAALLTASAAAALTWGDLGGSRQPAENRQASRDTVSDSALVCAAPDGVLHAPAADDTCPDGYEPIDLSTAESGEYTDPWNPRPSEPVTPGRLGDIERRIAALERAPLFEVVDKADRMVFRVAPHSARLYQAGGDAVAELRARGGDGFMTARSSDGSLEAFGGTSGDRSGFGIREADRARIELSKRPMGNYTLIVSSAAGYTAAGIGESQAGTGLMSAHDDAGRMRASIAAAGNLGAINVFNSFGRAVLTMTEGNGKGGSFAIGDAESNTMLRMNNNERYGAVLTGPGAGFPLVSGSGLPGSYILGCASCTP